MSRTSLSCKIIIALGALSLPISHYINKLRVLHQELSSKIVHHSETGDTTALARFNGVLNSLPQNIFQTTSRYVVIYDKATKYIQKSELPKWDEQRLLTTYLRHNMSKFANMPQAWILWLMSDRSTRQTFSQDFIDGLDFKEGDRVCGYYIVLHRQADRVEMGMSLGDPSDVNFVDGRLIIGIKLDEVRNQASFRTRTLMWRREASASVMPLERSIPKWFHELASWGLIEEGVKYLVQLKQRETS